MVTSQPDLNSRNFITTKIVPPGLNPRSVDFGGDGNLWFAQDAPYIGRVTSQGIIEYPIPSGHHASKIARGPGGLWFTEFGVSRIGIIHSDCTPDCAIHEFGGPKQFDVPLDITQGNDGNMWFIDSRKCIGRITPRGVVMLFDVCNATPQDIANGREGLYYTEGPDVGVVSLTGEGMTFKNPSGAGSQLTGIIEGPEPDGDLYVGEHSTTPQGDFITQVSIYGQFTRFRSPVRISELVNGPQPPYIWVIGTTGDCVTRCKPVLAKFNPVSHHWSSAPLPLPGLSPQADGLASDVLGIYFASGTGDYIGEYQRRF